MCPRAVFRRPGSAYVGAVDPHSLSSTGRTLRGMEHRSARDHYAQAVSSSDLTPYPRSLFAPVDVLTAAGMAAQRQGLGMLLQRVRVDASPADRGAAEAALVLRLKDAVRRRQVRRDGVDAAQVVAEVMAWWLAPTCRECGGVKREVQHHRLTARCCKACKGSGERQMESAAPLAAVWVLEHIRQQEGQAAAAHRRVMR
jgi:hypothetical protein